MSTALKPKIRTKVRKVAAPVDEQIPLLNTDGSLNRYGVIAAYTKAANDANAANETRYADILSGYNERYQRNMGNLAGAGAQEAADINSAALAQQGATTASLVNAGLAGTTVAPTMQAGVEKQRLAQQARLNETLRQQKLAADTQLSGDTLAFKERRTDQQPNLGMYAELMKQAGTAGDGNGALYGNGANVPADQVATQKAVLGGWNAGTSGTQTWNTNKSPQDLAYAKQQVEKAINIWGGGSTQAKQAMAQYGYTPAAYTGAGQTASKNALQNATWIQQLNKQTAAKRSAFDPRIMSLAGVR